MSVEAISKCGRQVEAEGREQGGVLMDGQ